MKTSHSQTSVCRRCRYYDPEGRRGGHCQQLNVTVEGTWSACALAIPPFSPTWENFEDIMLWQQKTLAAMEESALAESLEPASCTDEAGSIMPPLGDRVPSEYLSSECVPLERMPLERMPSEQGFSTASTRGQLVSTEPKQTMGIKALWM